jgi:hypothetical protein
MPRTTVASISTAAPRRTPSIFSWISDKVASTENTATMITAALVTTPALLAMPPTTASGVAAPRARNSRILLRMNTW